MIKGAHRLTVTIKVTGAAFTVKIMIIKIYQVSAER